MRIVYCIAKTCASGGMERVLSIKANYLARHGYEVIIITTDQRNEKSFFSLDSAIKSYDLDVNYEENNGKSFWHKLAHFPYKKRIHKQRLSKLLLAVKPDVVISMFCNDASFITDIHDGSIKILEIHFSKFKRLQYGRTGLWKLVDKYLTREDERTVSKFDRFVVLTKEDKSFWGALPNIEVIANPLPFDSLQVSSLTAKKALAIGRFDFQKGFERLIHAWSSVHKVFPEWKLDIIGEGALENTLKTLIHDLQLERTITLLPPSREIGQHYLNASFLVMSSRYEGLPMVLLEAQSFGLPAVSFDCKCGPSEIISHGTNGYLAKEGDIKELSDRMIDLISDPVTRIEMGQQAKKDAERFSQMQIMQKWINLFENK
ncbi:MAG: glycosyltransferase family 4 protein [Bacteroidales bacterium]